MSPAPVQSTPEHVLPERGRHPYYIYTPPYTRFSAGIRTLHTLCHALNQRGQSAFVLPFYPERTLVNPDLQTPILTDEIADFHFTRRRTPIVVYPEVIDGNPLMSPVVARYVLNFPGLLGGTTHYDPSELCYGYSAELAKAAGAPGKVLFLPVSDTHIFRPRPEIRRTKVCFYARKYRYEDPQAPLMHPEGAVEITHEMSPAELADLFARSRLLYCYENTAIALEAALCNCPVVFLPNPHLTALIATDEISADGFAWGDSPEAIEKAKKGVRNVFPRYLQTTAQFWGQLDEFIATTQRRALRTPYDEPVRGSMPRISPFIPPEL